MMKRVLFGAALAAGCVWGVAAANAGMLTPTFTDSGVGDMSETNCENWGTSNATTEDAVFEVNFDYEDEAEAHVLFDVGGSTDGSSFVLDGNVLIFHTRDGGSGFDTVSSALPAYLSGRNIQVVVALDMNGNGSNEAVEIFAEGTSLAVKSDSNSGADWAGSGTSQIGQAGGYQPTVSTTLTNTLTDFNETNIAFAYYAAERYTGYSFNQVVNDVVVPSTILLADFDGSAAGRIDDQAPDTPADVLNAGTTGGTWTVTDDQESIINQENDDASNHALAADRGAYDMEVTFDSGPAVLATNKLVFSFDSQLLRATSTANEKEQYIIGWDDSATPQKVFEIMLTNDGTGSNPRGRLAYFDQSGVQQNLADSLPSLGSNPSDAALESDNMTTLRIEMSDDTMDITVTDSSGTVLATATDVAYRTDGVANLASISLEGTGGTDTIASGAWFDNITVEVVPEPSTLALAAIGLLGLRRRRR